MPVYEYSCEKCDTTHAIMKPIAQAGADEYCALCKNKMKKLISKSSFHLKGGGVGWEKDSYSGGNCKPNKG